MRLRVSPLKAQSIYLENEVSEFIETKASKSASEDREDQ